MIDLSWKRTPSARAIVLRLLSAVTLAAGAGAASDARAGVIIWTGGGDGASFGHPGNWAPAMVPGPSDHALFDTLDPTVTFSFSPVNDSLTVDEDADPLFQLGGNTYTIATQTIIGDGDVATLSLGGGSFSTGVAFIGDDETADGSVTLGAGAAWDHSGELLLGNNGAGALLIGSTASMTSNALVKIGDDENGNGSVSLNGLGASWTLSDELVVGNLGVGSVSVLAGAVSSSRVKVGDNPSGVGAIVISGAGASWVDDQQIILGNFGSGRLTAAGGATASAPTISIGKSGAGTMIVQGGATVTTMAFAPASYLGEELGASGGLTIRGSGSALGVNNPEFYIGNLGDAAVDVLNGASLSSNQTFVADDPGTDAIVTVSGPAANWNIAGELLLGNSGAAELHITEGGAVTSSDLANLGDNVGGAGDIFIDGAGSLWTANAESFIGNAGTGSLMVTGGGAASTTRVKIGDEAGSVGNATVTGAGSTWSDSVEIFIGNFGSGTLNVTAGGVVDAVAGTVADDPGSIGMLTIDGPGSRFLSETDLRLGVAGTAVLTISDGGSVELGAMYQQNSAASLRIILTARSVTAISANGNAQLAGSLIVELGGGFVPPPGGSATIVEAASIAGSFADVSLPAGSELVYEPTRVRVLFPGTCTGDIDGSGDVGFTDLLAVLTAWGPCAGCPEDLDGSGEVGFTDLLAILTAWGPCG